MGLKDLIDVINGKTGIVLKIKDKQLRIEAAEVSRLFKETASYKKDGVITITVPDWLLQKADQLKD